MKKVFLLLASFALLAITFNACVTVRGQGTYSGSSNDYDRNLTAGKVQKEIHKGMSGAEVTEILGSPNIVTADENGYETWVYDKIATEASYSKSNDALFLFIYGQSNTSSNYTVTQKTLTVVIKLKDNKVDSFAYHSSKF
jgi:outer membrane protein assembly factor BamE (lipoprotein component of BamABCDE complex)